MGGLFDRGQYFSQVLPSIIRYPQVPTSACRCSRVKVGGLFDRGQAASVRRASSLIITSTSSQIKCSDMMRRKPLLMQATKHLNVAFNVLEEASSDIACFLYGRCQRKAISATVKVVLWLQPPIWPSPPYSTLKSSVYRLLCPQQALSLVQKEFSSLMPS